MASLNGKRLDERLKDLRSRGLRDRPMTQPVLGNALGVSVPLISSWEKDKIPPARRIEAYARLFGADRTTATGKPLPDEEMTETERAAYLELLEELTDLRAAAEHRSQSAAGEIRSPFQFPAGQPIIIICSELPGESRQRLPYSDVRDPNFISAYQYADLDALIELYGFLKAVNPRNSIQISVPSKLTMDLANAHHLIALGGIDFNSVAADILRDLRHVPVAQRERSDDLDEGAFTVRSATHLREFRPQLVDEGDRRVLKEDIAFFLRTPSPYNRERTATVCNGMFGRGTFGVVRALTDPEIQHRNNEYLAKRFREQETYSILCRVKLVANEIVVPDWTVDDIRLHEWPEDRE